MKIIATSTTIYTAISLVEDSADRPIVLVKTLLAHHYLAPWPSKYFCIHNCRPEYISVYDCCVIDCSPFMKSWELIGLSVISDVS